MTIVFVGFSSGAAEQGFPYGRPGGKEKSEPLPIASVEVSTPAVRPHCYSRGGNGALRFLGLRSRGPIAVSASIISRFDLRLGGSSTRGVVVATAVVSTASPSITLAWSPAARRSSRVLDLGDVRLDLFCRQVRVSVCVFDLMLLRHEQNSQLAINRGLRATDLLERLVTMLAPVAQKTRNYLVAQPVTRAGLPSGNVA